MDKYIGKRLEGRYEIQSLIGVGGMANVYKAYDVIDQRTVAVKILREEYLGNTEFLRRFKNESKAIAVLSHPNIVRVYDVSFNNRIHSIVMEYIDGITLKDYIERQSVLTWKEAVHFTLQILRALQHAHDKGIVHRDIKPHNIMLLQNGTIKVTDFGIARFARSEVKTVTDKAIGSVHYISPEQAMGDNTDEKSDIYSVGVMLFEMLTGRLPFEADSAVSVALKQIQTQAVKPRSINPDIPEGLEDITVRAMQKDSRQRYQSAAEMIADIERFKQDPSIHFQYKYMDTESELAGRKKIRRAIKDTREEEEIMPRRRRTPYLPILTGVTMAFVLISIGFIGLMVYFNNPFTQVEEVPLPDLVGLKIDTVQNQFDNFDIVVAERVFSNDYGKDVIIEQTPKAGLQIKAGTDVKVTVSEGQEIIELQNFAGKNVSQVIAWLNEKGLKYKEERVYSEEAPSQTVIYTDPSKDSSLPSGTTVTLYVSMGPEETIRTVPDLMGLTQESAKQKLELYNLRLGTVTEEPSDQPAGTVIKQSPSAGSLQLDNNPVDITISVAGLARMNINLELPTGMDRDVQIWARVGADRDLDHQQTINPAETGALNLAFSGDDDETELMVRIYIEGKLYKRLILDFTDGTYYVDQDNSDADWFEE